MDVRALIKEAQNPQTSADRLTELATHAEAQVRRAVARNQGLDEASLVRLLDDQSWEVRAVAAHNPKTPKDKALAVVAQLVKSEDAAWRSLAARSPLTPVEDLEKLADDPDPDVRSSAAHNRRLPPKIAKSKLTDPQPAVVLGALAHPSISNDERRAFVTEEFLMRFFETHADGDHLFEALCERYLWDVLERAFLDNERFDDVWQELVRDHFELVEIPSRNSVLAAVHRDHWRAIAARLAKECGAGERAPM